LFKKVVSLLRFLLFAEVLTKTASTDSEESLEVRVFFSFLCRFLQAFIPSVTFSIFQEHWELRNNRVDFCAEEEQKSGLKVRTYTSINLSQFCAESQLIC